MFLVYLRQMIVKISNKFNFYLIFDPDYSNFLNLFQVTRETYLITYLYLVNHPLSIILYVFYAY
jgi:hypothetical protein